MYILHNPYKNKHITQQTVVAFLKEGPELRFDEKCYWYTFINRKGFLIAALHNEKVEMK